MVAGGGPEVAGGLLQVDGGGGEVTDGAAGLGEEAYAAEYAGQGIEFVAEGGDDRAPVGESVGDHQQGGAVGIIRHAAES